MNHSLVFQKACDAFRLAADLVPHFPKVDRYSIGARIEASILDLIEHIAEAETTVPSLKDRALIATVVKADICMILIRLALERKLIGETNYFVLAESFQEVARMANGWRKSLS